MPTEEETIMAYKQLESKPRQKHLEEIICQNAYHSYCYACHVLKNRFILGEETICKSINNSCFYACDVIKGRFIEAEELIAQ
jgi:hypothetical protein